jgi:predicted deacetylase
VSSWLNPIQAALDKADAPTTWFFRDDDAGWADDHLLALLDRFETYAIPIDLAVIPGALQARLAANLRLRWQRTGRLGLHQHGFSHINHETQGRKCEFGTGRLFEDQLNDLHTGQQRLQELLASLIDPIFTPPWNRCTQDTIKCLKQLGFRILSRDASATPLNTDGLLELPVSVDWCRKRNGQQWSELAQRISSATQQAHPIGIMLHHAVMDQQDLRAIEDLLALLANHSNARCLAMCQII